MINAGLVILLIVILGAGFKVMDKIDKFIENGGFSKEEN